MPSLSVLSAVKRSFFALLWLDWPTAQPILDALAKLTVITISQTLMVTFLEV